MRSGQQRHLVAFFEICGLICPEQPHSTPGRPSSRVNLTRSRHMAKKAVAGIAVFAAAAITLSGCSAGAANDPDNTIDGEPKGDIKVVTWRTDLVEDGTFDAYVKEFNKEYPDVKV